MGDGHDVRITRQGFHGAVAKNTRPVAMRRSVERKSGFNSWDPGPTLIEKSMSLGLKAMTWGLGDPP